MPGKVTKRKSKKATKRGARKPVPKKGKATRITAWSFSRRKKYNDCPLSAKFAAIDKIKEPANDAMNRGKGIHNLAEDYITKKLAKFPKELSEFEVEFRALRRLSKILEVECELAFTQKWEPCEWYDMQNCWVRIKADCMYIVPQKKKNTRGKQKPQPVVLKIIDFKTGKVRPEHVEQLDLYALAGLLMHPEADIVEAELWYIDSGDIEAKEYEAADVDHLKKFWESDVKKMMSDRTFKANPGRHCSWCYFSQKKHKDCKY